MARHTRTNNILSLFYELILRDSHFRLSIVALPRACLSLSSIVREPEKQKKDNGRIVDVGHLSSFSLLLLVLLSRLENNLGNVLVPLDSCSFWMSASTFVI